MPNEFRPPFSGKLATDGGFTIDPEDPGDYEVILAQPGTQLYIRSLLLDGHPITGRNLRLRMGQVANLEVVVGGDAAHLIATVTSDPSLPKPEPSVAQPCEQQAGPVHQLVLFPDPFPTLTTDSDLSSQPIVFFGNWSGDRNHPQFRVDGLPPGTYPALVAENLRRLSIRILA